MAYNIFLEENLVCAVTHDCSLTVFLYGNGTWKVTTRVA